MGANMDINWIQRVGQQLSQLWSSVSAGSILPSTINAVVAVAVILLVALGIKRIIV